MKIPFPPKRILVAVDLSKPSLSALQAAKRMARHFGSTIELVYVEPPAEGPLGLPLELEAEAIVSLRRRLLAQRRDWRGQLRRLTCDLPPRTVVMKWVRGWPAQTLPRLASLRTADLVVTGTHGYRGVDRALFGSISETLARHARIPVLSVHEGAQLNFRPGILVPHHLRPYADDAMLYAVELAKSTSAPLTALYVAESEDREVESSKLLHAHIDKTFGTEAARSCRVIVRRGAPREEMLLEAEEGRYGLIVLSAHLRPLSPDVFLGTTAERLLRRSRVPVLAVPAGSHLKIAWRDGLRAGALPGV